MQICNSESLERLQADCLPELAGPNPCECCTSCCNRSDGICEDFRTEAPFRKVFADIVGDVVNENGSPYDNAASWLISFDSARLSLNADNLIQRYILAVFYYLTTDNDTSRWRSCNPPNLFLGETSECVYEELIDNDVSGPTYLQVPGVRWLSGENECSWSGVICDSSGFVTGIDLGMFYCCISSDIFENCNARCIHIPNTLVRICVPIIMVQPGRISREVSLRN